MSRYINADDLLKEAYKDGAFGYVSAQEIKDFPAADVVEVRRGYWDIEWYNHKLLPVCSVCGCFSDKMTEYCARCGASMTGKEVQQ